MRRRHQRWMTVAAPDSEVVVDIKGPGQVVGEVVMEEAPPPARFSARARGDVLALKLTQVGGLGGQGWGEVGSGAGGRGWTRGRSRSALWRRARALSLPHVCLLV
jgi:hypothetical protein